MSSSQSKNARSAWAVRVIDRAECRAARRGASYRLRMLGRLNRSERMALFRSYLYMTGRLAVLPLHGLASPPALSLRGRRHKSDAQSRKYSDGPRP